MSAGASPWSTTRGPSATRPRTRRGRWSRRRRPTRWLSIFAPAARRAARPRPACSTSPPRAWPTSPAAPSRGALRMHVAAIIAAGGAGRGLAEPAEAVLDARPAARCSTRSVAAFARLRRWSTRSSSRCRPAMLAPASSDSRAARRKPLSDRRGRRAAAGLGGQRLGRASTDAPISSSFTMRRGRSSARTDRAHDRGGGEHGAAIAAVPRRDTVKQATPAADGGSSRDAAARRRLSWRRRRRRFVATCWREAIALGATSVDATDEAMLAERAGYPVQLVDGDAGEHQDHDAGRSGDGAMRALGGRAPRPAVDAHRHRLRPAPAGRGPSADSRRRDDSVRARLHGHSDADIVCHAVTDAVLGAAGAGDIGRLFPDTDPRGRMPTA